MDARIIRLLEARPSTLEEVVDEIIKENDPLVLKKIEREMYKMTGRLSYLGKYLEQRADLNGYGKKEHEDAASVAYCFSLKVDKALGLPLPKRRAPRL
jgi:hypothetical protein